MYENHMRNQHYRTLNIREHFDPTDTYALLQEFKETRYEVYLRSLRHYLGSGLNVDLAKNSAKKDAKNVYEKELLLHLWNIKEDQIQILVSMCRLEKFNDAKDLVKYATLAYTARLNKISSMDLFHQLSGDEKEKSPDEKEKSPDEKKKNPSNIIATKRKKKLQYLPPNQEICSTLTVLIRAMNANAAAYPKTKLPSKQINGSAADPLLNKKHEMVTQLADAQQLSLLSLSNTFSVLKEYKNKLSGTVNDPPYQNLHRHPIRNSLRDLFYFAMLGIFSSLFQAAYSKYKYNTWQFWLPETEKRLRLQLSLATKACALERDYKQIVGPADDSDSKKEFRYTRATLHDGTDEIEESPTLTA